VHEHLFAMGKRLMAGFEAMAKELGVAGHAAGLPPAPFLKFGQRPIPGTMPVWSTSGTRELYREGIFINPRWFISYSHKEADIDEALEKARTALRRALDAESVNGQQSNHSGGDMSERLFIDSMLSSAGAGRRMLKRSLKPRCFLKRWNGAGFRAR